MRRKGTEHACGQKFCDACRWSPIREAKAFDEAADAARTVKGEARALRRRELDVEQRLASVRRVDRLERKLAALHVVKMSMATFKAPRVGPAKVVPGCRLCGGKDQGCARCELRRELASRPALTDEEILDGENEQAAEDASSREALAADVARRSWLLALDRRVVVGLVSCGADKAKGNVPARRKYTSALFRKSLSVAVRECDEVYVLSAFHHVVRLDQAIGDYDLQLSKMLVLERDRWNSVVRLSLHQLFAGIPEVELRVWGSRDYCDGAYSAAAGRLGWSVTEPLAGLQVGQRLHALNDVLDPDLFFTKPERASAPQGATEGAAP
jgi:hypothetical protein